MRKFLAETYSAEKLSAELANSESVTFIAYKNGTPLGYLKLNIGNAQTEKCLGNALEIQRIYILKSAKGQGIGSAFMQIAENFASEKKLSTIWLGVWEHNEPAKKFYKSKGYEKFSHHTFVIGDDMQTDFLLKKKFYDLGQNKRTAFKDCPKNVIWFKSKLCDDFAVNRTAKTCGI